MKGSALMIEAKHAGDAASLFERLSDGRRVTVPFGKQFWGDLYGNFTDRFGVQWAIIVPPKGERNVGPGVGEMSVIEIDGPTGAKPMFRRTSSPCFPRCSPARSASRWRASAGALLWSLEARDIREHGIGRHRAVDDTPAGGGPGMVMRADVLAASLDAAVAPDDPRPRLMMSPRGEPFTQSAGAGMGGGAGPCDPLPALRGRRRAAIEARGLIEVSIGDYVLSGGEIAALAVLDACVRLITGVWASRPRATRRASNPACSNIPTTPGRGMGGPRHPRRLLSGDHAKIAAWRRREAERITKERRPDLAPVKSTRAATRRAQLGRPRPGFRSEKTKTFSCRKTEGSAIRIIGSGPGLRTARPRDSHELIVETDKKEMSRR